MMYFLDAWSRGRHARQCGRPHTANPYTVRILLRDVMLYQAWRKGWDNAYRYAWKTKGKT